MIERGRSNWPGERRLVCDARAAAALGPLGGLPCARTKPAASSVGVAFEAVGCAVVATRVAGLAAVGGVPSVGDEESGDADEGDGTEGGDGGDPEGGPEPVGGPGSSGAMVCTTCCTVCVTCVTTVVAVTEFVWNTSPSSPGLKIRIDVAMLHIPHPESGVEEADGAPGASQLHCQFQIHVPAASAAGSTAGSGSLQFHVQFQIQVDGGVGEESGVVAADGVAVVVGITGVELVLPEFPL